MRVLLVDDHVGLREPLAHLLRAEGIEVLEAGTLSEARELLAGVDVLVVDLGLPDGEGRDLIPEYLGANPVGRALVLSASTDEAELASCVAVGAAGLLNKTASSREITSAVRRLGEGGMLLSRGEVTRLAELLRRERLRRAEAEARLERLTPREVEVLRCIAEGMDDKGLSASLGISGKTARRHIEGIFSKLGVQSRLQAVLFALRHGAIRL